MEAIFAKRMPGRVDSRGDVFDAGVAGRDRRRDPVQGGRPHAQRRSKRLRGQREISHRRETQQHDAHARPSPAQFADQRDQAATPSFPAGEPGHVVDADGHDDEVERLTGLKGSDSLQNVVHGVPGGAFRTPVDLEFQAFRQFPRNLGREGVFETRDPDPVDDGIPDGQQPERLAVPAGPGSSPGRSGQSQGLPAQPKPLGQRHRQQQPQRGVAKRGDQWAVSQFGPAPVSTISGTSRSAAPDMQDSTAFFSCSSRSSRTSKTSSSCTCMTR